MSHRPEPPNRPNVGDSIDASIDRALATLRDAQPRAGSELFAGRILHALEARSASRQRPTLQLLSSLPFATWTTAACVLALAATLLLTHTFRERRATETRTIEARVAHPFANAKGWGRDARITNNPVLPTARTPSGRVPQPALSAVERVSSLRHGFESPRKPTEIASSNRRHPERSAHEAPGQLAGWGREARSRRSPVFANCVNRPSAGCPIHDGGAALGMGGVAQTPTDAQALADLHAPSHPAPPLPLSPQEKALLRMLRRSNSVEIASLADLNPVIRAARDADEAAAFHAFFPDPPPIPQPNGDTE
jgi:hypothetical protein